ncbi:Protein of unknown function [bacterium A37T11]|nr:Protein of unknown function [bacterium A37T11]
MISPKLESSRKELLDLSMRNSLLNYKIPKARGLHIVQEKSAAIFDILVKLTKSMTFLGRPDTIEETENGPLPSLPPYLMSSNVMPILTIDSRPMHPKANYKRKF